MGVTKMNLTAEMARKWLILFNKKIQEKQDYLSNLDTPIGDGDHGHNMARGMTAVVAALNDNQTLQEVFKATAMALISKVGVQVVLYTVLLLWRWRENCGNF
jgi:dihydroxyacetone kinase-like protein